MATFDIKKSPDSFEPGFFELSSDQR